MSKTKWKLSINAQPLEQVIEVRDLGYVPTVPNLFGCWSRISNFRVWSCMNLLSTNMAKHIPQDTMIRLFQKHSQLHNAHRLVDHTLVVLALIDAYCRVLFIETNY